ncbi:MAG: 3-dehydroquinate synthase, partial [Gammaproteobacteria bacterium]
GYGTWLHGEAVATGMLMAADLSMRMGWISAQDVQRTRVLLENAGLPVTPPTMSAEEYLQHMAVDKKVKDGQLRLVLLKQLGKAVVSRAPADLLRQTLQAGVVLGGRA